MTHFPKEWEFARIEAEAAAASSAGWDEERAAREFVKFREWHQERATGSSDWQKSWKKWCETGAGIDRRDTTHNSTKRDKVGKAFEGVRRWYDRQRAAAAAGYGPVVDHRGDPDEEERDDGTDN